MRHVRSLFATLCLVGLLISCGGQPGGITIPDTPDGTVQAVATHLADGHPEVLWLALPPSYQADLTEVTHLFAQKMDPELYAKVFDLARKIVTVLGEKKAIILDASMLDALGEDRARVEANWDSALGLCTTLFNSELADLEAMKTLDYNSFLSGTGVKVMADMAAISKNDPEDPYEKEFRNKLTNMTVETVSVEGDRATLKISVPDQDPEEVQLIKVENRWVPAELAAEWQENMTEAKEKLNAMTDEEMAQTRVQAMMGLAMVEGMVDQVAAVTTTEELETMLQGLLGGLMGGGSPMGMTPDPGMSDDE